MTRRQRRHEEIDKYMSEIQQKQHTAKMASDSWLIAVVLVTVVYQVSREHIESAEQWLHCVSWLAGERCSVTSSEWRILRHDDCFIQGEVIGFQVLLDSLHPRSTRASWWSPPVLQGEAVKILASVSSSIQAMWSNWETPSLDNCQTMWLLVSLYTWWYHLIPNSLHEHHCSRTSIFSTHLLLFYRQFILGNHKT